MTSGVFNTDGETAHDWARERMSPYMDGQLSPAEAAQLEAHIRNCVECANELLALRTTRQLLQAMPSVRLPRAFTLEAAPRRQVLPRAFFFLRTATAVTAAVFVALLAASLVLPFSGPAPASAPAVLQSRPPAAAAPAQAQHPTAASAAASQAPQRAAPAGAESKAAPAAGAASSSSSGVTPNKLQAPAPVPQAPAAAPADTASAPPKASPSAEPGPSSSAIGRSSTTTQAEKPAQTSAGPGQGPLSSLLLPFQLAAASLTVIFALASSTIWWIHRRRRP